MVLGCGRCWSLYHHLWLATTRGHHHHYQPSPININHHLSLSTITHPSISTINDYQPSPIHHYQPSSITYTSITIKYHPSLSTITQPAITITHHSSTTVDHHYQPSPIHHCQPSPTHHYHPPPPQPQTTGDAVERQLWPQVIRSPPTKISPKLDCGRLSSPPTWRAAESGGTDA